MADFRPGTICTHATPIPEGHEILQRLLTNDCRMLAPILKLIATVLLFRYFFGKCVKWSLFLDPITFVLQCFKYTQSGMAHR